MTPEEATAQATQTIAALILRTNNLLSQLIVGGVGPTKQPGPGTGASGSNSGFARMAAAPFERVGAQIQQFFSGLFLRVAGLLGPLALLYTTLNSNSSGMQVFFTSIKLVGTILGGLLAPVFLVLTAATYAVAAMLAERLLPRLGEYYEWLTRQMPELQKSEDILTGAFEALAIAAESVQESLEMLEEWIADMVGEDVADVLTGRATREAAGASGITARDVLGALTSSPLLDAASGTAETLGREGRRGGDADRARGRRTGGTDPAWLERERRRWRETHGPDVPFPPGLAEGAGAPVGPGAAIAGIPGAVGVGTGKPGKTLIGDFGDKFKEGALLFLAEMQRTNSTGGSGGSVADIARQAQQAALQQSPFEAKAASWFQSIIQELTKITAKITTPVAP